MTTRKSNNRTEAKGKPVKTIDLTAEDVTKVEASQAEVSASISKPAAASKAEAAAEKAESTVAAKEAVEKKTGEAVVASDGPKEDLQNKDPLDEKAQAAVEESAKADDAGVAEKEPSADDLKQPSEDSGGDGASPPSPVAPAVDAPKSGGFAGGFVGGLLGGVAIVALGYVGLQQGWFTLPSDTTKVDALQSELKQVENKLSEVPRVDVAAIDQKLAALEGKIEGLGAAPVQEEVASEENAVPVDSNSPVGLQLEALTGRIDELKQSVAAIDGLKTELLDAKAQLATLQAQTAEQGDLIVSKAAEQADVLEEELKTAKDDILSSADRRINDVVVQLANFSDKISSEATALGERVTALEENNLSEKMQNSAQTIALAGLENAVASGADYSLALKTFANVVGDHEAVKALGAYASTGAPTAKKLASDFRAKYDDILREAEGAGATTLLDKFLISAQSMVKVHSLNGEQKGKSLTSRLGVIEFHVKQGDLVKAGEEWDALPDAARNSKAGADWVEGLKARIAVNAAMDTIRTEFGTGASNIAN